VEPGQTEVIPRAVLQEKGKMSDGTGGFEGEFGAEYTGGTDCKDERLLGPGALFAGYERTRTT